MTHASDNVEFLDKAIAASWDSPKMRSGLKNVRAELIRLRASEAELLRKLKEQTGSPFSGEVA